MISREQKGRALIGSPAWIQKLLESGLLTLWGQRTSEILLWGKHGIGGDFVHHCLGGRFEFRRERWDWSQAECLLFSGEFYVVHVGVSYEG